MDENCPRTPMSELSTWSLCKYSTYSCTRAFQNVTKLRNHEEICPQINVGPEINTAGGSANNVRRLLKDLKIVLKRSDSNKPLPVEENKPPDQIHRNSPKENSPPLRIQRRKELRIILKRCDNPTSLLEEQNQEAKRSRRSCAQATLNRISQMSRHFGAETEENKIIESDDEQYNSLTDSASDSESELEPESESDRPSKTNRSKPKAAGQCKYCDQKFPSRHELGNHTRVVHPRKKRFVCDHEGCDSKFTLLRALISHKVVHTGIKPFKCPDCPQAFFDRSSWRRHKRFHTKEYRFTCKICDKKFIDTSAGKHHMLKHTAERKYKCNHCDKFFKFPYSVKHHEKKFHSPNASVPKKVRRTFTCNDCRVEFRSCINLKNHMCNSKVKIIEPEIPMPENITSDELEVDPFADTLTTVVEAISEESDKIPGSSATESSKSGLVHVNLQDIVGSKRTAVIYEDDDDAVDIKYHADMDELSFETASEDNPLKSFPDSDNPSEESNHMLAPALSSSPDISDSNERPGHEESNHISIEKKPSLVCKSENTLDLIQKFNVGLGSSPENVSTKTEFSPERSESTILGMKSEIQSCNVSGSVTAFTEFPVEPECSESEPTATPEQMVGVAVAGAYVRRKYNIPAKVRTLNSDGRFQCNDCEKSFVKVSHLNKHEKIHRPKRPYVCDHPLCEKSFTTSEYLSNHKYVHVAEPRFKCNFCSNRYRQPHGLKIHMRTHTLERPYKCEHCPETFVDLKPKKLHILRHHTKERPFKCKWCDKRCFLKEQMKLHETIHTGEKPHRCKYCNQGFRRPNCLRRHEAIHLRAPGTRNFSEGKVKKVLKAPTLTSSTEGASATSIDDSTQNSTSNEMCPPTSTVAQN